MAKTEKLADRVKKLRDERGWSQTDLAKKADVSAAFLSRLMTGEREMTFEYVEKIARALGKSPSELVAGTEHERIAAKWVEYDKFDVAERGRISALQELDVARREIEALKERVAKLAEAEQAAKELPLVKRSLDETRAALERVTAERDERAAQNQSLRGSLLQCNDERANLQRGLDDAGRLLQDLRKQAAEAQVNMGILSGFGLVAAALVGAAVASESSSKGRRR
jgi:transcriptional regulator with XRE-family HTH domain